MTTQRKLLSLIMLRGMSKEQATAVLELALPVLNKTATEINGMEEIEGKMVPINPYIITWESPSYDYPQVMYAAWFEVIKPIGLEWINKNKPQAWFRDMFI